LMEYTADAFHKMRYNQFSTIAIHHLMGDTLQPTKPLPKSYKPVSIGQPFSRMQGNLSSLVTSVKGWGA